MSVVVVVVVVVEMTGVDTVVDVDDGVDRVLPPLVVEVVDDGVVPLLLVVVVVDRGVIEVEVVLPVLTVVVVPDPPLLVVVDRGVIGVETVPPVFAVVGVDDDDTSSVRTHPSTYSIDKSVKNISRSIEFDHILTIISKRLILFNLVFG